MYSAVLGITLNSSGPIKGMILWVFKINYDDDDDGLHKTTTTVYIVIMQ